MSSSNAVFVADARSVFRRVPLMLIGVSLIVLDMGIGFVILNRVGYDSIQSTSLFVFSELFVVACLAGFLRWKQIQVRRTRVIARLDPGVLRFHSKHRISFRLDGLEPLSEQEQVSTYDQADSVMRSAYWLDVVIYAGMLGVFLILPIMRDPQGWWIRISMITLFAAIALRWLYLGDGLMPGFNRLRIDPVGWEWGGWSRWLSKSGRWEDTRVLIKQITKDGRERYFVVLGDENGTVGMIVPRASMVLIERAYVSNMKGATP